MSTPEQRRKHAAYIRQWYKDNPEKWKAIRKRYNQSHREQHNASSKKYRERYPEKKKAQSAVGHALRDGRLIRPEQCQNCHEACVPEGHHEDYTKFLEVTWLCFNCHRKVV